MRVCQRTPCFCYGYRLQIKETINGIVMSDRTVVAATTLTLRSTLRSNFAANIVVVAAVGAAHAMVNAIVMTLCMPRKYIVNAAISGITSRRKMLAK